MLGFRTRAFALSALLIAAVGCGGEDDEGDDSQTDAGTGGSSDAGTGGSTGNATTGAMLVQTNACGSCHTGTAGLFAGNPALKGPNLTPDTATGIGSWSEAQIVNAVLNGTDDEGDSLCSTMVRYKSAGMTDQQAKDIAAYLKSIPAISNATPDSCN